MNHNVLAMVIPWKLTAQGKFSAERAREQEIPLKFWNRCRKDRLLKDEGKIYTPDMVLVQERGLSLLILQIPDRQIRF